MFEYSVLHWTTFFTAVLLLELSPGADMAFMVGQTVRNGRRAGFSAMFGIISGTFVHIAMAAVGLSAVIATSAAAFSVVKWLGVAYLVWLGVRAFAVNKAGDAGSTSVMPRAGPIFWQGVLISALNPKVAIFFLAFLPQFVVEGAGPVSLQLLLHGTLMIAVSLIVEPLFVVLGARAAKVFKSDGVFGRWGDRCLGVLYVTLGVRLAVSKLN